LAEDRGLGAAKAVCDGVRPPYPIVEAVSDLRGATNEAENRQRSARTNQGSPSIITTWTSCPE